MKTSNKSGLTIICLVLAAAALVCSMINVIKAPNGIAMILEIANICAIIFAGFYFIMGYKKDAAEHYKKFLYAYAVATFIRLMAISEGPVALGCCGIVVGAVSVLTFAADLGKKKSSIFAYVIIAANLVSLVYSLVGGKGLVFCLDQVTALILSALLLVMLDGKYADKAERGSK